MEHERVSGHPGPGEWYNNRTQVVQFKFNREQVVQFKFNREQVVQFKFNIASGSIY